MSELVSAAARTGATTARGDYVELAEARIRESVPGADLSAMAVVFTLIRAADRITQDLERVHRPVGWTWAGFRVMFWVWVLGPLEPRELARLTSASRASISSVLNTLERDGLITRGRDSVDRRLVKVELTGGTSERIATTFRCHNAREQEWVSPFDEVERATLVRLLGRILDDTVPASADLGREPDGQGLD